MAAKSPDLKSKFLFMYLNDSSLPVPLHCTQTLKRDVLNRATISQAGVLDASHRQRNLFITLLPIDCAEGHVTFQIAF